MNAQELKERTKKFALRVMHLVDALPDMPKGRAVASQLVRSGMSVAANYRAACRGRSHAEFISKIGVAEEEADELTAIMAASYISASRNKRDASANSKSAIRNQRSAITI
jgi:four helix bundle protein